MKDRVIFRKWNKGITQHGDDIIAILPDNEANQGKVAMYESVGQHGEGDYFAVMSRSTPSKPEECKDLLDELTGIGYELRVMKRLTR